MYETVAVDDGRVRVSYTPLLSVTVEEPRTNVPAGRRRVEVRYALTVWETAEEGRLTIVTRSVGGRLLTALVGIGDHYEVLPESHVDGHERTFTLKVAPGETRRLVVVDHPAGLAPEELPGLLPHPDEFWRAEAAPRPPPRASRAAPPLPPPVTELMTESDGAGEPFPEAAAMEAASPELFIERDEMADAVRAAAPEPAEAVLAEVGANMPAEVRLEDTVPVEVLLSREDVPVFAGTGHDEQVIVMDPDRPLDVVLLRRGFDLDDRELPHETGRRSLWLPPEGEPAVRVIFWLRAAQEGEGEVQVVVRQDDPQPLATLRLSATVLPRSGAPVDRATAEAELGARARTERTPLAGRVTPFLNPQSLVVDENLVGVVSELSFDLVLPRFRCRLTHVVPDKTAVLKETFRQLDLAWRDIRPIPDPMDRSAAFQDHLRDLGWWLAQQVLPRKLLQYLRDHLDDMDELAVITSGETDIPWELVYVWEPGVEDPEGRGFLGRMGLVRWVYNTPHPKDLSARAGRCHYLIPEYLEPSLVLEQALAETTYLQPFGATAIDPPDAAGIAQLITGGEVDLLHFAGHGFSNDTDVPPVREMALAGYRPGVVPEAGADRSGIAFSLEDLRRAMPERPFADPGPLVVLNACRIGQAPSTRSEVGGFAETFLRGGAGAFVGCLWSVGDRPARAFVAAFYAALDAGHTIAQATLAARRSAREAGDISWLAYTVYAHPDARLADRPLPTPVTDTSSKGTAMTATSDAARATPALTVDQLRALHPFVVSMEDGRLAQGASTVPTGVGDFRTVAADIDELFAKRLPDFLRMHGKPVPMVLWAHGGLVDKAAGLRVAHSQVAWWQANGVFPVHFVWRTGLAESLWDAVKDALPGRARGLEDVFDTLIEAAVRGAQGKETWSAMKTTAKLASEKDKGGAWHFAQKLAEFTKANPGSVTVHAAGHSAGSIFHSYLVPQLLAAGVEEIASLNLLAPAIRVDEFKQRIMKKSVFDKIRALTMFTMSEPFEKNDTCLGVYRKSLLYLIRAALEDETRAEILGLQECLRRDKELAVLLGSAGSGAKGEVMWSQTVGGGPRTSSLSKTHGGFDNDAATMNSLARRVTGNDRLTAGFGTVPGTRGLTEDTSPWPSEKSALDYIASRQGAKPQPTGKRALCVGIDMYPSAADQLGGCVADARAWKQELEHLGFAVDILEDGDATRQNIVTGIQDLVVNSRAGDVLVVQYSGHGTTIEDLDGDDLEEATRTGETSDEALCPVDFREGELLIDDDLGQLWDLLPEGVNLTVFFDSCHSGGGQRNILQPDQTGATTKARLVRMTTANVEAFKARRGGLPQVTRSLDSERSVYFGACQATELAFESNGHGDFTRIALPRLREFLTGTNQEFFDAVLTDFGGSRRQTPVLLPPPLASNTFLAPVSGAPKPDGVVALAQVPTPPTEARVSAETSRRDQAVASILRGVADLIES